MTPTPANGKELIFVQRTIEFFLHLIPPTATHQEKAVRVVNGKPRFYEPESLKAARAKLTGHLARHRPEAPLEGPLELVTGWYFPATDAHPDGSWRITRPDTDNLQKLLKDCMTGVGFWQDDAQVCREIAEKFYSNLPGIRIRVRELVKP